MKRNLTILATLASISLGAVSSAQAMGMEFNMLTGAVYNELSRLHISTDGMMDLTLTQVAKIHACSNSGDGEDQIRRCIEAAVRN